MTSTLATLVRTATAGDTDALRAAARLMSAIADAPQQLPAVLQAIADVDARPADVSALAERLSPRLLLGITGAPGSGKSTLTDALVREYRARWPNRRVGVIAVDPSSPFTGGAVLGDRVRMMRHATDPLVYIRSMASRGHLGGLALGLKGVVRVMSLIGCDVVLVETVGVGQSEIEVASVADLVAIVLAPGQGDSIQLLKAGLLEIGDLFVVNKADRPDAARLHSDLLAALQLSASASSTLDLGPAAPDLAWSREQHGRRDPRVALVSAASGDGIAPLVDVIEELVATCGPAWQARRREALVGELREAILEAARERFAAALATSDELSDGIARLLRADTTIEQLALELLANTLRQAER